MYEKTSILFFVSVVIFPFFRVTNLLWVYFFILTSINLININYVGKSTRNRKLY